MVGAAGRSPDIVVLIDEAGTIRYVSPSAEPRTGWSPEQVVGRNIVDLVHPDDIERAAFDLVLYTTGGAVRWPDEIPLRPHVDVVPR